MPFPSGQFRHTSNQRQNFNIVESTSIYRRALLKVKKALKIDVDSTSKNRPCPLGCLYLDLYFVDKNMCIIQSNICVAVYYYLCWICVECLVDSEAILNMQNCSFLYLKYTVSGHPWHKHTHVIKIMCNTVDQFLTRQSTMPQQYPSGWLWK